MLLTSLAPGSGYSWQVRAVNGGGTTIAGGGWWGFTTPGTLGLNADVTIDFGSTYGLYTLYDFAASPAWQSRHPLSPTKLAAGDLDGNGVGDACEAAGPPPGSIKEGDLVVTELMIDPSLAEPGAEWLEIKNVSAKPIDLNGLQLVGKGTEKSSVLKDRKSTRLNSSH